MSIEQKKSVLYIAVDVEKKGASFDHPIIQIGVAWSLTCASWGPFPLAYGTDINSIKTASFCFDYKDKPFEKRCYDEFWIKYLDILKRIEGAAKPSKEQWKNFDKWLVELESQAESIKIVSDNPGYDIEAIDYHLHEELGRFPIRYDSTGKYRSISDASEQIKGLPAMYRDQIKAKRDSMSNHSHWAEDDARSILVQYFLVKQTIDIINKADKDIMQLLKI